MQFKPLLLLHALIIAVTALCATTAHAIPPLIGLSMPNPSQCGAPTFDVFTGLSADSGAQAATRVNLSTPTQPVLSVTGTSFEFFWGFADHSCGGASGAAANSFAVVAGTASNELVITDYVANADFNNVQGPHTYDVADIFITKLVGNSYVPVTLAGLGSTQGDFNALPGIAEIVTGIDVTFSLSTDPPINLNYSITLPGSNSPQSFSVIPEPASLALIGIGLIGLGIARKRWR